MLGKAKGPHFAITALMLFLLFLPSADKCIYFPDSIQNTQYSEGPNKNGSYTSESPKSAQNALAIDKNFSGHIEAESATTNKAAPQENMPPGKEYIVVCGLLFKVGEFYIALFTSLLFIFTALLWWATLGLAKDSKETAGRQFEKTEESLDLNRKMFIADQRPWVSADVEFASGLVWNANGATINLQFTLKNTGKSPALNVMVNPSIYPLSDAFAEPIVEQKNISERERKAALKQRGFGFTLFPGDRIPIRIGITLTNEDIKKSLDVFKEKYQIEGDFILPYIVGCICCKSTLSTNQHQTGFIYELLRSDPITPQVNQTLSRARGDVEASQLTLRSWLFGGGITD